MAIPETVGLGRSILRRFKEAGLINGEVSRVVIDIPCNGIATVYIERLDSKPFMELLTPMDFQQMKIVTGGESPKEGGA